MQAYVALWLSALRLTVLIWVTLPSQIQCGSTHESYIISPANHRGSLVSLAKGGLSQFLIKQ